MAFVVAIVAVIPLRADAAHQSEMISQLLFGEIGEIMEGSPLLPTGTFTKVRCLKDGYEGWCQSAQLAIISDELYMRRSNAIMPGFTNKMMLNETEMQLPFGCSLAVFQENQLSLPGLIFKYKGELFNPGELPFGPDSVKRIAHIFINTPYLWGGRSLYGIDCSGLVQQVYGYFNIQLPRDAYQQAELGTNVGFLAETKCGDLAFFDNKEGKITHVGILLDEYTIIHASGIVRIDFIDQAGILNKQTGERTHQLRIVKRLL
ncbi:C40 family peptidase [Sediminibacterium sp.]|uniref:C40 family peptidase n=1 Tax=Sediminibacterium sp. TaxID=1917865 RepID=UPI003F711B83